MRTTASQKIKLGIYTIIALVVLVCGIFEIGNQRNIFSRTFSIYGIYKNISGLQIGDNVRFGGINVGNVTEIAIVNDTTIRVTMNLKEHVHRFLKDDATASIGTDGLMGDKLVNISPGPDGQRVLASGGVIRTVNPVDYDRIISHISSVANNADAITASLAAIAGHIRAGKGSLGKLLYSDSLEKGLEYTVTSAHETIKAAHKAIDSASKGVEGFDENMDALKHNFLLRGYYKRKARRERREQRAGEVPQQPAQDDRK